MAELEHLEEIKKLSAELNIPIAQRCLENLEYDSTHTDIERRDTFETLNAIAMGNSFAPYVYISKYDLIRIVYEPDSEFIFNIRGPFYTGTKYQLRFYEAQDRINLYKYKADGSRDGFVILDNGNLVVRKGESVECEYDQNGELIGFIFDTKNDVYNYERILKRKALRYDYKTGKFVIFENDTDVTIGVPFNNFPDAYAKGYSLLIEREEEVTSGYITFKITYGSTNTFTRIERISIPIKSGVTPDILKFKKVSSDSNEDALLFDQVAAQVDMTIVEYIS